LSLKHELECFKLKGGNMLGIRIMKLAAASLLAGAMTTEVLGAVYYVDFQNGNDANSGLSTTAPFRTFPGSRTFSGGGFVSSPWGGHNATSRGYENTTFRIKGGTRYDQADGGYVWVGSDLYDSGCTNIVFQSDQTWGPGRATIDGSGMSIGIAALLIQVDGVTLRGISVQNSPMCGIQAKEHTGSGTPLLNLTFDDVQVSTYGTSATSDAEGAALAGIVIRNAQNVLITNCVLNGSGNFANGILFADNSKAVKNARVVDTIATAHVGDLDNNDSGIGFKALNSQVVYERCRSYNNLKGFDMGEQSGSGSDILYTVLSCIATNNAWGVNYNGPAGSYGGKIQFRSINNLIANNSQAGMNCYAAPYELYVVHCVFDNNGAGNDAQNGAHLIVTPNDVTDSSPITAFVYNNVFKRAKGGAGVLLNKYFGSGNNFSLKMDFNSYERNASEVFAVWSYYSGGQSAQFSYGSNGPGYKGNWFNFYGSSTSPAGPGTGHLGCDFNSRGTSCPIAPVVLDGTYHLAQKSPGMNLTTQPWYVPEMGIDAAGQARQGWDMGLYEVGGGVRPPANLRVASTAP